MSSYNNNTPRLCRVLDELVGLCNLNVARIHACGGNTNPNFSCLRLWLIHLTDDQNLACRAWLFIPCRFHELLLRSRIGAASGYSEAYHDGVFRPTGCNQFEFISNLLNDSSQEIGIECAVR